MIEILQENPIPGMWQLVENLVGVVQFTAGSWWFF